MHMRLRGFHRFFVTLLIGLVLSSPLAAQSMEGNGAVATGLLLRQLDGVKRVLMIGAHPDDEDTGLLTTLARGWGVETAYLSLTRGGGGQNLIGPELFEGLGVIRSGELVASRSLDGGAQFFTRAFDYGYSKSADEALSLWPNEELLSDVVWVIRQFRPHVVVSVFSGTPRDGHGQHQAAGIMARQAFSAAGDPSRFSDQLSRGVEAWAPAKLYESARGFFRSGGDPPADAIQIQMGSRDPLLGRSLYQLSRESRSQHRSQDMGAIQAPGLRATGVRFIESRVGGEDGGMFEGVDTTLVGLTAVLPMAEAAATRRHLESYRTSVRRAVEGFGLNPSVIAGDLGEAVRHLQQALAASDGEGDTELYTALARKIELVTQAFMAASGLSFDLIVDDELVVPGQVATVMARLWNASDFSLVEPAIDLDVAYGWDVSEVSIEGLELDGSVIPGSLVTWTYHVNVPSDADLSKLYYLRENRDGAWYRWPDESDLWGLPRDPEPVGASVSFEARLGGQSAAPRVSTSASWRYVGVDPGLGQFEEPVLIVPSVSVEVMPRGVVWPASRSEPASVSVVLRNEAEGGSRGHLSLQIPSGWSATPNSHAFDLPEAGSERTLTFRITPFGSAMAGEHVFQVQARTDEGNSYSEGYSLIDYDHVERAALFSPAEVTVTVVPVSVAEGLHVGYVMGSGDSGPEAIRQLGVGVEVLNDDQLRAGDFAAFDAIVLGVRSYETREALQAASDQLLDFAREGGTIVAQYNRGPFGSLAPRPLQTGRGSPRVADETAPIRMLDPEAPILMSPNRIGEDDFEGWVQERGLYFASDWDDSYEPILELNDPGEEPRHGSLLVTQVGEGIFVFTALSFFRQWSARVPGAYRLFANLISVDAADWRAYAARQ